ncbi:ankyrin repeat domain-containing protein [Bdellovibrionota bacterium FG-2]
MLTGFGIDLEARSTFGHQALHWTLRERSWEVAEILIDAGAPVDDLDGLGKTPLMLATNWPELVEILILRGANVNYVASNGWTPLNRAALSGGPHSFESVKILLVAGARSDLGSIWGKTLLDTLRYEKCGLLRDDRLAMIKLIQG